MAKQHPRRLIVNADDFGQSERINGGVVLAHTAGIVTAASLMVRWPAARDAVGRAREHPALDLGLHVDLGEWIYENEGWHELHASPVRIDDPAAVEAEVLRQLERFRVLVGSDPSHLDSHQHVHREEPIRSILRKFGDQLGIPVRGCDPEVRYLGTFYGQSGRGEPVPSAITVGALVRILERLPPGVTELGCHPGFDTEVRSMYARERSREVDVLCDPRIRPVIELEQIELISFRDVIAKERRSRIGETRSAASTLLST